MKMKMKMINKIKKSNNKKDKKIKIKMNKIRKDNNKINKKKMTNNNKIKMIENKSNNFKFHILILKANQ